MIVTQYEPALHTFSRSYREHQMRGASANTKTAAHLRDVARRLRAEVHVGLAVHVLQGLSWVYFNDCKLNPFTLSNLEP